MRKVLLLGASLLTACSSSSSGSTTDAGSVGDAGGPTDGGGGIPDATIDVGDAADLNGCTAARFSTSNHTAPSDPRKISFPTGPIPDQFNPQCITIRAGQSVTWEGAFMSHPFGAFGGTTPSPIPETSEGTSLAVAFPSAGEYGFHCEFHPEAMAGAIVVLP